MSPRCGSSITKPRLPPAGASLVFQMPAVFPTGGRRESPALLNLLGRNYSGIAKRPTHLFSDYAFGEAE
jgi:hypothetical protein